MKVGDMGMWILFVLLGVMYLFLFNNPKLGVGADYLSNSVGDKLIVEEDKLIIENEEVPYEDVIFARTETKKYFRSREFRQSSYFIDVYIVLTYFTKKYTSIYNNDKKMVKRNILVYETNTENFKYKNKADRLVNLINKNLSKVVKNIE